MSEPTVIVGVEPGRSEQSDAIALGAALAHYTDARLLLVSVFEPRPHARDAFSHQYALRRAAAKLGSRLDGLEVEQLVLPGVSAARVLHRLADEHTTVAVVIGSSPHAPWGMVELGHVSERVLHGGNAPMALAPRGYAARSGELHQIGIGYAATPESDDALAIAANLAVCAGAALRLITVFDPVDYLHEVHTGENGAELRLHAERSLVHAVAGVDGADATTELLDGDPAEVLARRSADLDLLVLGSRSYGPLRAVLLGGVSGVLVHRAACPVMVVPHAPEPELEARLVGGLEAGFVA